MTVAALAVAAIVASYYVNSVAALEAQPRVAYPSLMFYKEANSCVLKGTVMVLSGPPVTAIEAEVPGRLPPRRHLLPSPAGPRGAAAFTIEWRGCPLEAGRAYVIELAAIAESGSRATRAILATLQG